MTPPSSKRDCDALPRLRVLHVEDEPTDQLVVARSVRDATHVEFEIEVAETLAQALTALAEREFELVALDLSLPDSFGSSTLESILATGCATPVVVMTGHDDDDIGIDLVMRGAEDFLAKSSLVPEQVASCFRFAVERHRSRVALDRARRDAEAVAEAKSQFLASMSHEIRTPLNAIIGMADLLADADLRPEEKQYVEVFRRSGQNLLFLLNNVLELSSLQSRRVELAEVPFSPRDIASAAVDTFSYAAHKKTINLALDDRRQSRRRLIGDPDRIRQVLVNLIGNAVKFTDQGHVLVRIESTDTDSETLLQIDVEDTGPGVPENARSAIFESYVRADHGADVKSGTGLGLSICVQLVEAMGGKLSLESECGVGSRFRVELPLAFIEEEPDEVVRIDGMHVLVAAYATVERTALVSGLEQRGCEVVACDAIDEAEKIMASASEACPDAVVVDCRIRGGGMEFVENRRRVQPELRAIALLPVDHRRGDMRRCRAAGATGLLRPADVDELCSALLEESPAPTLEQEPASSAGSAKSTAAAEVIDAEPLRILLAEDGEENRFLIQSYLAHHPYAIEVAVNGVEAVERACPGVYDVVLMDMNMPEMGGLEATQRLREFEREAGIENPVPILALTADAFAEHAERCRKAGCDEHLAKPIAKRDLLDAIARYGQRSFRPAPDHDMIELVDEYLAQRMTNLAELRAALEAGDFETAATRGHNMKGTGRGYGFPIVSALGAAIEQASKAGDARRLDRLLGDLEAFIARGA